MTAGWHEDMSGRFLCAKLTILLWLSYSSSGPLNPSVIKKKYIYMF